MLRQSKMLDMKWKRKFKSYGKLLARGSGRLKFELGHLVLYYEGYSDNWKKILRIQFLGKSILLKM